MAKPFNPLELVARVKSQLRRYTTLGNIAVPSADADKLISGGLVLDTRSRTVAVDGEDVKLTPIEFHILRFLMENMNTVFSTSQIYEAVWKEEAFASENIIAVHIRHIREKIELNPKEPKYLKVVWGQGYKLEKI